MVEYCSKGGMVFVVIYVLIKFKDVMYLRFFFRYVWVVNFIC